MDNKLSVSLNHSNVVEYDRNRRLPGHQRQFLDKMDDDMSQGFELAGEFISSPDAMQRAKFVAMQLIMAVQANEDGLIAATCAYLANRYPDMQQVQAVEQGEQVVLELIFTGEERNMVTVQFQDKLH